MTKSRARAIARDIELSRRVTHALGGLPALLFALDIISWSALGVILWVSVAVVFVLEYLRLERGVTHAIYKRLTRPYESTSVAAYAYYVVGMSLSWLLFPPAPALLGIAALVIGDPLSGALSSPNDPTYRRAISALAIALVAGVAALALYVGRFSVPVLVIIIGVGAFTAIVSDMYAFRFRGKPIDDNLLLPLVPPASVVLLTAVITLL